jgi:hypothetical protein
MSDAWQDLPLSRSRSGDDESGVSNDWRLRTVDALRALATVLDGLGPEQWAAGSLRLRSGRSSRSPYSVAECVGGLVAALDARPLDRFMRRIEIAPVADAPAELRRRADALAASAAKGHLHPLTLAVVAAADVTVALDLPDPIAPLSTGSVALGLAATAPAEIRGAMQGRSLVPDDGEWAIARGPAIRGTGATLVAWLSGRDVMPWFDRAI